MFVLFQPYIDEFNKIIEDWEEKVKKFEESLSTETKLTASKSGNYIYYEM